MISELCERRTDGRTGLIKKLRKSRRIKNEQKYRLIDTGFSGKIVFITIHCNPSLAYIAVRYPQSSQRNASVQSLLFAGIFLYNQ